MENSSNFFSNPDCEYFPCHSGIKREIFNCMFCYCPLYHLDDCGGNYQTLIIDDSLVKDCSACLYPHYPASYKHILRRLAP